MANDVGSLAERMRALNPRIDFPFLEGAHIRFRFADALAACQRCSGDESANPMVLIQKLAMLDLHAVQCAWEHGAKHNADGSPIVHAIDPEVWPVQDVANALIAGLEVLLFGTHPEGKPLSIQQTGDRLEALNAQTSFVGAMGATRKAAEEIQRVEAAKAEGADHE